LCLVGAAAVLAQPGERPSTKLFGGASAKSSPANPPEDRRRRAEIDVELAWLADPITFPYFLEAHLEGAALTVTGYVPDKQVRDQALRLARLHTAYVVADGLKEHPSLLVRPGKTPPAQLQSAASAALREALPKHHAKLQVQCATDGMVTLSGPVSTIEEKLAASVALRRLYGCASVQNLIQTPGVVDTAPPATTPTVDKTKPPPMGAPANPPTKGVVTKNDPAAKGTVTKSDPPAKGPLAKSDPPATAAKKPGNDAPHGPILSPAPAAKKDEPVKEQSAPSAKLSLSAAALAKLQKRVQEAIPEAKGIKLEVTPANKLQIELTVRSDDQISAAAGKLYSLPEVMDYREELELHFTVQP
jgi:hypothetical protein